MKRFAILAVALLAAPLAFAQDPCVTPGASPKAVTKAPKATQPPLRTTVTPVPAPAPRSAAPAPRAEKATQEELDFLANGPRLYSMDEALALSAETGKPVFCWMGKHLFRDERARALSTELGSTTIQAVMDSDGDEGKIDPRTGKAIPYFRVKFSSSNYRDQAKAAYIPLDKMDLPGAAEKALAFARGGR